MSDILILKAKNSDKIDAWLLLIFGACFGIVSVTTIVLGIEIPDPFLKISIINICLALSFFICKCGHSILLRKLIIKKNQYVLMKRWFGDIKINIKDIKEWYIGEGFEMPVTVSIRFKPIHYISEQYYYLVLRTAEGEYAYPFNTSEFMISLAWQTLQDYFPNSKLKYGEKIPQRYPNFLLFTL